MSTILVFAGGDPVDPDVLDDIPAATLAIAADGGYDIARALGHPVDVIVGDLDSISGDDIASGVAVVRHSPDKDKTDLDLAMELASAEDPDRIIVVGGAGGRHDHEMATSRLILSDRWRRIDEIDWLSGRSRVHVIRGRRMVHGDIGSTVSLIAAGGGAYGVTTRGLKWNLDGDDMTEGSTRGVSNQMTSPVADLKVGMGALLFVIPTDQP